MSRVNNPTCPDCKAATRLLSLDMYRCKECKLEFKPIAATKAGSGQIAGKCFHRGMKWGSRV